MIVIATDSSACLTKQEAHQLGVIYVPMTYTLCGKTYTERFIGANGDFVPLLESEPNPHTSQPAVGRYLRTFKALRKAGFEVLCLTISSRLSGTFSNASACAHDLGSDGIRVVDTRTTAIGLAFLASGSAPSHCSGRHAYGDCRTNHTDAPAGKDRFFCQRYGAAAPQRQAWPCAAICQYDFEYPAPAHLPGWRGRLLWRYPWANRSVTPACARSTGTPFGSCRAVHCGTGTGSRTGRYGLRAPRRRSHDAQALSCAWHPFGDYRAGNHVV